MQLKAWWKLQLLVLKRKYHKSIESTDRSRYRFSQISSYTNGILEVVFNKKENVKPKGKEVKSRMILHYYQ